MKKLIIIAAVLLVVSCKRTKVEPSHIINDAGTTSSVSADGASQLEIKVKLGDENGLPINLSSEKRTVTFKTTSGSFNNNSQEIKIIADSDGNAICFLKGDRVGEATVTAEAVGVSISKKITFTFAYPKSMLVILPQATMPHALNTVLHVKTKMLRDTGNPTNGLQVKFYAVDNLGNSKGTFLNYKLSDDNDTARAEFHLLDSTFNGILYIKGSYHKPDNDSIYGTNQIFVK
jgi:hypothetical protein